MDREMNIVWNTFPNGKGRTKLEILEARANALRDYLNNLEGSLTAMAEWPCGLECSGCGEYLATEKDFAAHFIVSDERFLNLGECPNKKN